MDSTFVQTPHLFHRKFDFKDGDIILRTSGNLDTIFPSDLETYTDHTVASLSWTTPEMDVVHFRVHQSVLVRHSEVFANMLSMPQPSPSRDLSNKPISETITVPVHDEPEDLIRLLTVLYYPESLPPAGPTKVDFLGPVLRLADKYGMEGIIDTFLPPILHDWPMELGRWDIHGARARGMEARRKYVKWDIISPSHSPNPNPTLPSILDSVAAIELARNYPDASRILPSAYYALSTLVSVDRLLNNQPGDWHSYCGLVTREDLEVVARGQAGIRRWVRGFTQEVDKVWVRASPCPNAMCTRRPLALKLDAALEVMASASPPDVLMDLYGIEWTLLEKSPGLDSLGTCFFCRITLRSELEYGRARLWARLPELFGLTVSGWDTGLAKA